MSAVDQKDQAHQSAFYGAQYGRFGSSLAAQIRVEAYGVDMGQQGWRTEAEHREIIALVEHVPDAHLLDIACGSGGPSLAIAAETGCWLTGIDIAETAISEAGKRAAALGLRGLFVTVAALCPIKTTRSTS